MTHDLIHAVTEIRAHADDYRLAADYYHGEVPEVFTSPAVKRALRGALGGFDINLARRPVDAVLDRMAIHAVSVPGDDAATRQLINTVWIPNRLGRYSKRVHWAALTYGDAYMTVWPGDDDGTVEVHFNNPVGTRVFYSSDNERVKSHAARLWSEGTGDDQVYRCDLLYPDRVEQWVTLPGRKGDAPADWREFGDEGAVWPLDNPYGEVPVFHWRSGGEPYGRPEHRGAFGPQNAITKLSTTLMSTIDFQGFPQRYELLNPDQPTADAMFDFDEDDTANPDDAASTLNAGPGTVWRLDAKGVGQFDPANVEAFLKPLNFYARAMSAATATPLRFLEPSGQVPSGESLRADDAPLSRRIEDREEVFEETWQEVIGFAARVAGLSVPEVDVAWSPVQTVSDEAGWRTTALKMAAGVPARQALTEAGYTSGLVDGWLDGSSRSNLDTRLAALGQVGDAMQKLGAAVQLGALDKAQVDAIVAQIMGDLVRDGDVA